MKKSELKEFIKSEIINELEVKTPVKEGVWSVVQDRIPEFLRAIAKLKDDYYEIVGSDDVFDGLDRAESAAQDLMDMHSVGENTEDEISQTKDLTAAVQDLKKAKDEAGIEEDMSGVDDNISYADMEADDKKKYGDYVDHSDIGQFAIPRDKWDNYDDDYFYALGVRIVKEKFAGDVAKAYDTIVRQKSKEMDAVGYTEEINEDEDAEPKKADIKKNKGFNKAKDELALLTQEMKSLAKKYSKAEGEEKEKLVKTLKSKTKLKKELESILNKKKL